MQKLRSIFSNSVIVVLLLVLGLGLVLFLSNQSFNSIPSSQAGATLVPATPIDAVKSTRIPTVIPVIVTIFPTPTPAPSPTPTPTFEPLSDKPIMGFVFKPPREIPNTRNSAGSWEIVEWLPDKSEEVLVKGPLSLEVVDVVSGTIKTYATVKEPGNISHPKWLYENHSVAYLSRDFEANETNLFLGNQEGKPELLLSNVEAPLIPVDNGRRVAVYSKNDEVMVDVSPNTRGSTVASPILNSLPRSERGGFDAIPYIAVQPNGDWIAHYNIEGLKLVNSKTGEEKPIELGGTESLWAMNAKWSPDGGRLALIVTEGGFPSPFSDLYILDWPAGTLHKIQDTFTYVTDIAWAPDSQHLVLGAVIGKDEYGVNITALYIVNISNPSEILPVPIPINGLGINYRGGLAWSPDGKTILVQYFDGQHVALYQIEVTAQ